jgi:hypothetical protein
MLVMFAVGVAVLWWMAALTALMVYEKVGRHGVAAARVAGVVFLAVGAVQLAHPVWLPTAFGGSKAFASDLRVGPGPGAMFVRTHGYALELRLEPNRALRPGAVSLKLLKGQRPVRGARVRATYTMLDMEMGEVSARLPQVSAGTYSRSGTVLTMAGRWRLRLEIAPRGTKPFTVGIVDHVAP